MAAAPKNTFHDSLVGRKAAPTVMHDSSVGRVLPALVAGSGGGGDFSELLRPPAGQMPATPSPRLEAVSPELHAALQKWGQGSGLIDPTRTGTDPEIVKALKGQFEPSPWEGDWRWNDFFHGRGLVGDSSPPTNAIYQGKLVGPGGGAPIPVAGPVSPKEEFISTLKSLNPYTGEGIFNLAGVFGGPRVKNPQRGGAGTQFPEMGFGHAEKEWPSSAAGFTIRRVDKGSRSRVRPRPPDKVLSDEYGVLRDYSTRTRAQRGNPMGSRTRQPGRLGAGTQMAYNWVNDATGEIAATIEMLIGKDTNYVNWQVIQNKYKTPEGGLGGFFNYDVGKLHEGIGKPVQATISSAATTKKGEGLGKVLAKLGTVNPLYEYFTRQFGTAAQRARVGVEPDPYENLASAPSPRVTPVTQHQWGSAIPAHDYAHLPGAGADPGEPGTFGHLSNAIVRRLDREGHGAMADEIHDANIASPRDRVLIFLQWMRENGYTASQIAPYRGMLTRIGYQDRPRTLVEVARALFTRLEQDHRGEEARDIRASTTVTERRISQALQVMRDENYHPYVIRYFEDMLPEGTRLPTNFSTQARSGSEAGVLSDQQMEAWRRVTTPMAQALDNAGLGNDVTRISAARPNRPDVRAQHYLDLIRAHEHFTDEQVANFEQIFFNTRNRYPTATATERPAPTGIQRARLADRERFERRRAGASIEPGVVGWAHAADRMQGYLRNDGWEHEVAQIVAETPLPRNGDYNETMGAMQARALRLLDFMHDKGYSQREIDEFMAYMPETPQARPPSPRMQELARIARQREIEDELDSIGHYPEEGSSAAQRYQQLDEEWGRLDREGHAQRIDEEPTLQALEEDSGFWDEEPVEPTSMSNLWSGQFSQELGPSGQRLAPPGQPGWENASAHLAMRLSEDGHSPLSDPIRLGHPDVRSRAREYLRLMEDLFYPRDVIDSYERLFPERP